MNAAIANLRDEHDAIASSLRILDRFSSDIEAGSPPADVDLATFVTFLSESVDRCHQEKEEQILFPALVAAGLAERGGPLEPLVAEHLLARDLTRQMRLALQIAPDYLTFSHACRSCASLLRKHIRVEDEVLFPMADRMLDEGRLRGLLDSFRAHERAVLGSARERFDRGLDELRSRYP